MGKQWERFTTWLKEDELKMRRWLRAFLAWVASIMTQVLAVGYDTAMTWSWKDWAKRLAIAAIFGTVGAINLGEKNPTPDPVEKPAAAPSSTT